MKPIGWTVTCALLAVVFSKSALSTGALGVEFQKKDSQAIGRAEITRLAPLSNDSLGDPDVEGLRKFFDDIFGDGEEARGNALEESRTFGHKRIQFMLMPMMYKMGVMMTLMTVLTVISLKGLAVGVLLLVLKLGTILAKFHSGWGQQSAPWSPQPIHVHVHNSHPSAQSHAYAAWEPGSGPSGGDDHYYYKG